MKYFSIDELCRSSVAEKKKIDNTPSEEVKHNLNVLIENCLDPIREKLGKPITVTSGYRSEKLNKEVGGVSNSDHKFGYAADLVGDTNTKTREIFEIAKGLNKYTQLLYEKNSRGSIWVHISFNPKSQKHQCIDNYNVK